MGSLYDDGIAQLEALRDDAVAAQVRGIPGASYRPACAASTCTVAIEALKRQQQTIEWLSERTEGLDIRVQGARAECRAALSDLRTMMAHTAVSRAISWLDGRKHRHAIRDIIARRRRQIEKGSQHDGP